MPRKNIRVDIPIGSPLQMKTLIEAILARHAELAAESPLLDPLIDMAGFQAKFTIFDSKRDEAGDLDGFSQAATEEADIALGINEGQDSNTEGTIYFIMTAIIDRLLLFYKGKEEQLSTFGFNVVKDKVRGRVTRSVELPITEPEKMLELVDDVLERHAELGAGPLTSPLDVPETDMATLATLQTTHRNKRKESKDLDGKSQATMEEAHIALGINEEQTILTVGTLYNIIVDIRDKLLGVHRNNEEQLSTYGFNVVISTTPLPGEEEPEIFTGAVNAIETLGITDTIEDGSAITLKNTGTVELIFCRAADAVTVCDPAAGTAVAAGAETETTGAALGASGIWLNVTNNDPADAGAFEVTIE